jgi:hypothetical protein
MVTRPGSSAIPPWMEKMSESAKDPFQFRKNVRKIALIVGILSAGSIIFADVVAYRARVRQGQTYNSALKVRGLPLLSVGRDARGVIAVGGRATGIVAIGGVAVGVIALGGLSVGVLAFGGVSVGLLIFAGVAVGWRAIGAVALGHGAVGAVAVGRYACGTIAYGRSAASGQVEGLIG